MTKRFEYIRGKYKHGIHDTVKDGEYRSGHRTTYDDFDLDKLTDELNIRENRIKQLENENEELKSFKQRVFDLIDKTIEEETQIAENIEEVAQETRPYAKAINRITIKTLEDLKLELQ